MSFIILRFIEVNDIVWFKNMLKSTAESMLGDDFKEHFDNEETFFVNFLREAPEPTGDEPEDFDFDAPKTYEEIPRYSLFFYFSYL